MTVRAPNGATLRGDFVAEHGYSAFRDRGLALRRQQDNPLRMAIILNNLGLVLQQQGEFAEAKKFTL